MNRSFQTKQDYAEAMLDLCAPLRKHYSQGRACLKLGPTSAHYDDRTMELEAFSRPLWGLVPLWAGGQVQPMAQEMEEIYLEGFRHGPDPAHPEYWGKGDVCHQMFVEMAAMGLGLLLTPEKVWAPLSPDEKENLNTWLLQINQYPIPQNNWLFFQVLVNIGLQNVGGRYDQEAVDKALDKMDTFYLGDGWYSDGNTMQRDYYIPFAMHFYSLIYAGTMKDKDPKRCGEYVARAKKFAEDFIYWFSEEGDALPFGRSLTYRFAQAGFFSALAFAGGEVFSWGVMKGIVNRHMRSWFQKPILDGEGLLTIGYGYPNLNMAEGYNAPGSPYWACKTFLVLALPDVHPFWTAQEEPLPKLDALRMEKHPHMVIQRPEKNHAVALTSGQFAGFQPVHTGEKYEKFAYSTWFGFNVPRALTSLGAAAPDNMLVFYKDGICFVRRKCLEVQLREEDHSIWSKWQPFPGVTVETTLTPKGQGHIRTHIIHAEEAYGCRVFECGFSLPMNPANTVRQERTETEASAENENGLTRVRVLQCGCITAGDTTACESNVNLLHNRVLIPHISFDLQPGDTTLSCEVTGLRYGES